MRLKRNKSGFTLLEIIIVVIIIGVLASLALPRLFKTVKNSHAAEALQQISAIRGAMERCYLMKGGGDYVDCDTEAELDIELNTSDLWTSYTITSTENSPVYEITATHADGDTIELDLESDGSISKCGTSDFSNYGTCD